MKRDVTSRIVVRVTETADLLFAIAVATTSAEVEESFRATLDGVAVEPTEMPDAHGGRLHRLRVDPGELVVDYAAQVTGRDTPRDADETELVVYQRPSRYAESDELSATAGAEFAGSGSDAQTLLAVSSWVGTRLAYVSGSSLPTDGATRTLLARRGVCRDFAHLCVALLRARGLPARLVSVYAPGLEPMDFHAVVEAWVEGAWRVIDATTLAPRGSLLRIATGRDAADTAFLTVLSGRADLVDLRVGAVADELPSDDLDELVSLG
ncbi:transglutaminase-like domain-containing protein [Microbacterium sp.]|uniref:transglutaminase-like domain-containing protein n=1 Tax=Microbacterium sp. TaxID=51671 RepID=UPI0039E66FC4